MTILWISDFCISRIFKRIHSTWTCKACFRNRIWIGILWKLIRKIWVKKIIFFLKEMNNKNWMQNLSNLILNIMKFKRKKWNYVNLIAWYYCLFLWKIAWTGSASGICLSKTFWLFKPAQIILISVPREILFCTDMLGSSSILITKLCWIAILKCSESIWMF